MIDIALDVMGGDNAPYENLEGALLALERDKEISVTLYGDAGVISDFLNKNEKKYDNKRIHVAPTTEVIDTAEKPVAAVTAKKDSSLVRSIQGVKDGSSVAVVSAGNSGAVLFAGQLIIGKLKGIKRAPLAPFIPTKDGASLLIDCGANVSARPEHLVQFAKIGSIYYSKLMGKERPTVGLVNIGAEEEKGNELTKETYQLLKNCEDINFIGNIEARDIPAGKADVVVCEAFVGNVILKLYEGVGLTLINKIKSAFKANVLTIIGALLVKGKLKNTLKDFDVSKYGGAPLLGLNNIVVKVHGNSTRKEVSNAIIQCATYHREKTNELIYKAFNNI